MSKIKVNYGGIPLTAAGKMEMLRAMLGGEPVYDEDGNLIGETPQLITPEQVRAIIEGSETD